MNKILPCDLLLSILCRYTWSTSSTGGLTDRAGTIRYTRDRKKNSTMRDTRFQPRMKPQPTTLEARVMTCPTASGARMLVTWSIRLMVAFIPFVRIKDTEVNVLPPEQEWAERERNAWHSLEFRYVRWSPTNASLWQTERNQHVREQRVIPLTSEVAPVVACDNHNPVPLNGNG